jgi:hypothetical protein
VSQMRKLIDHGNLSYRGLLFEITKTLAKEANFTAHHQIHLNIPDKANPDDFSASQKGKKIHTELTMDVAAYTHVNFLGSRTFQKPVGAGVTITLKASVDAYWTHIGTSFTSADFYYLITPTEFYSNYEKLVMPFETYAWICFGLSFALTFGIILVLNQLAKRIRSIILGKGIQHPAMNALNIFFGISQNKLPNENFARILLAMFIFLCMIFRTCYQSMMFEFMTTDMRKPPPESLEDLVNMNYTLRIVIDENLRFMEYHHDKSYNRRR